MITAFTGPDRRLDAEEFGRIAEAVRALRDGTEFRSGGAHGVDTVVAHSFMRFHPSAKHVLCRPRAPYNEGLDDLPWDEVRTVREEYSTDAMNYMARNTLLVSGVDILVAFPDERGEVNRSGTWATVRRGREHCRLGVLVLPIPDLVRTTIPRVEALVRERFSSLQSADPALCALP